MKKVLFLLIVMAACKTKENKWDLYFRMNDSADKYAEIALDLKRQWSHEYYGKKSDSLLLKSKENWAKYHWYMGYQTAILDRE